MGWCTKFVNDFLCDCYFFNQDNFEMVLIFISFKFDLNTDPKYKQKEKEGINNCITKCIN